MNFNIQDIQDIQDMDYNHHLQNRVENNHGVRSYDCVFCQRGFTTAQALGGHMNIHRKDRITPKTIDKPRNNNKDMLLEDEDENEDEDVNSTTTRLFFSTKRYLSTKQYNNNNNGGTTSSFEGRFSHFLKGSPMHGRRVIQEDGHGEDEVDLELRLGHYPL